MITINLLDAVVQNCLDEMELERQLVCQLRPLPDTERNLAAQMLHERFAYHIQRRGLPYQVPSYEQCRDVMNIRCITDNSFDLLEEWLADHA